jgi:hypothetical protein
VTTNTITTTTTQRPTGFGMLVNPETLEAAKDVAGMLAKSELVPKNFQGKPCDILIAGAMGARLGLDLFSALSGIAVVNGRPTLWGDAQLAVCQARPDFGGIKTAWAGEGDALACTVTVARKGHADPYVGAFSVADAKKAGLWSKQGPWSQYPRRMLELRARAFALRSAFADALAGFHAREEIEDETPAEVLAVRTEPAAAPVRRAKQRTVDAQADPAQTMAEPVAEQPAAEPQPEAQAAPDFSVDRCVTVFRGLWNAGDAGKASAKQIQASWKLEKIADLAGAADGDREAFIQECDEAFAKIQEGASK